MEGEREKTPINAEPQGKSIAYVGSDEQQPTTWRSSGSKKPTKCSKRGSSGTYYNLQNKKWLRNTLSKTESRQVGKDQVLSFSSVPSIQLLCPSTMLRVKPDFLEWQNCLFMLLQSTNYFAYIHQYNKIACNSLKRS